MKFGELKCGKGPITISAEDFNKYYEPITDDIYKKCLKAKEDAERIKELKGGENEK